VRAPDDSYVTAGAGNFVVDFAPWGELFFAE
jgi:hypothetical protein